MNIIYINKKNILKYILVIITIFIILFASLIIFLKNFIYKDNYLNTINEIIVNNNYNVDKFLILSIVKNESKFDKEATSYKNAKGLMQILDNTYLDINENMNIDNIYNINTNLYIGISYLNKLVSLYKGNIYLAIISYNAGMGNVKKWIDGNLIDYNFNIKYVNKIPFKETRNYLKNVINDYQIYKLLY